MQGIDPQEIIQGTLIPALNVVGDRFENRKIFVPEMMVSAKAMQACVDLVKPHLQQAAAEAPLAHYRAGHGVRRSARYREEPGEIASGISRLPGGRSGGKRPGRAIRGSGPGTSGPGGRPVLAADHRRPLRGADGQGSSGPATAPERSRWSAAARPSPPNSFWKPAAPTPTPKTPPTG